MNKDLIRNIKSKGHEPLKNSSHKPRILQQKLATAESTFVDSQTKYNVSEDILNENIDDKSDENISHHHHYHASYSKSILLSPVDTQSNSNMAEISSIASSNGCPSAQTSMCYDPVSHSTPSSSDQPDRFSFTTNDKYTSKSNHRNEVVRLSSSKPHQNPYTNMLSNSESNISDESIHEALTTNQINISTPESPDHRLFNIKQSLSPNIKLKPYSSKSNHLRNMTGNKSAPSFPVMSNIMSTPTSSSIRLSGGGGSASVSRSGLNKGSLTQPRTSGGNGNDLKGRVSKDNTNSATRNCANVIHRQTQINDITRALDSVSIINNQSTEFPVSNAVFPVSNTMPSSPIKVARSMDRSASLQQILKDVENVFSGLLDVDTEDTSENKLSQSEINSESQSVSQINQVNHYSSPNKHNQVLSSTVSQDENILSPFSSLLNEYDNTPL